MSRTSQRIKRLKDCFSVKFRALSNVLRFIQYTSEREEHVPSWCCQSIERMLLCGEEGRRGTTEDRPLKRDWRRRDAGSSIWNEDGYRNEFDSAVCLTFLYMDMLLWRTDYAKPIRTPSDCVVLATLACHWNGYTVWPGLFQQLDMKGAEL